MKIGYKYIIFISITLSFLASCNEVFEEDITDNQIILLSPEHLDTNTFESQNFWWDEDEDIQKYRLQVVTPSFSNPSKLMVDTLVSATSINYSLTPETYEWRVRGENGDVYTSYSSRSVIVDTLENITDQQVVLEGPFNGFISNKTFVTLSWEEIPLAESYQLQVKNASGTSIIDQTLSETEFELTNLDHEIEYIWRVRAKQSTTLSTKFTDYWSFSVDTLYNINEK